ncbi:MAG: TetR/AcrR family transcriptional regulator [Actinomycetales bacterium]|nr:MAG: TetR/AcrR family transcriptional regulator [Actinomycetales bacterium]
MTVSYRESVQVLMRDRLLDAAQDIMEARGWSAVTMSGIAAAVGVSRQTVHNELGTKHAVAEALTLRELGRFLDLVRDRIAAADDLVEAVRSACQGVLEIGESNILIRTIVGSVPHDADSDFLQLLTTESGEIVESASVVVKQSVVEHFPDTPFTETELDVAVDAVVRLILSHLTRPSKPAAEAAHDIAWIFELAVAGRS